MPKRRDTEWRDRASADLFVRHFPELGLSGPVLVMEDPLPGVASALSREGLEVEVWNRRAWGGRSAAPWPPSGPFRAVALRLPRAKDELLMDLHAAASVLAEGGQALLYGANDEGIQAALGPMDDLFPGAETLAVGGRCRILRGGVGAELPDLKPNLDAWRSSVALGLDGLPPEWASYPGIFAHGRLDAGTHLLLDALPSLPPGARVLDYGCGSGVIGYIARQRGEGVVVDLLDVDAVALEAARRNVPGSEVILGDGLPPGETGLFHAIFSNPPFHRGKAEEPEMIASLVRGAPGLLQPEGLLVFVVQRRIPLDDVLREHFRAVSVLAEDPNFRVWMGKKPR